MGKKSIGSLDSIGFDRLTETLAMDLTRASHHFELHRNLDREIPAYQREFNQSNGFWWLTINANLDACLFRLCRVYDGHKSALHLSSWLETIQGNMHLFDEEGFRKRLKGNPFVDSLAKSARKPDTVQLKNDITFASDKNRVVRNLKVLRNNHFAHRNFEGVVKKRSWLKEYSLTYADIESLLHDGLAIVNRYSILFKAHQFSSKLIGGDDYQFLLRLIRLGLSAYTRQDRNHG